MVNILIVEDEAILAMTVEISLANMGFNVVGISKTGEDACLKADRTSPDIVLMDIVLQGSVNGIEAARTITRSNCYSKIIFMTAYKDEEVVGEARKIRNSGFLFKPFKDSELRETIEGALVQ